MQNLDSKVFAVNLLKDGTGTYEFGAYDHAKDINFVPVDNSEAAWNLANMHFSIGGQKTSAGSGTGCVAGK